MNRDLAATIVGPTLEVLFIRDRSLLSVPRVCPCLTHFALTARQRGCIHQLLLWTSMYHRRLPARLLPVWERFRIQQIAVVPQMVVAALR